MRKMQSVNYHCGNRIIEVRMSSTIFGKLLNRRVAWFPRLFRQYWWHLNGRYYASYTQKMGFTTLWGSQTLLNTYFLSILYNVHHSIARFQLNIKPFSCYRSILGCCFQPIVCVVSLHLYKPSSVGSGYDSNQFLDFFHGSIQLG